MPLILETREKFKVTSSRVVSGAGAMSEQVDVPKGNFWIGAFRQAVWHARKMASREETEFIRVQLRTLESLFDELQEDIYARSRDSS